MSGIGRPQDKKALQNWVSGRRKFMHFMNFPCVIQCSSNMCSLMADAGVSNVSDSVFIDGMNQTMSMTLTEAEYNTLLDQVEKFINTLP